MYAITSADSSGSDRLDVARFESPPAVFQAYVTGEGKVNSMTELQGIARSGPVLSSTPFQLNPYEARKWSERDERDYTDLAFKAAGYELSAADEIKFRQMIIARRRDIPQRSAEQILLTAEHDQLILEMKEVLEKYHAFRIKLGPHHKIYEAVDDATSG